MLWNSIFDFFIQYIFGGVDTLGVNYYAKWCPYTDDYLNNANVYIRVPFSIYGQTDSLIMPMGNYLSFICTVISIIIILILCCLFIKKIISLMSRLFTGN